MMVLSFPSAVDNHVARYFQMNCAGIRQRGARGKDDGTATLSNIGGLQSGTQRDVAVAISPRDEIDRDRIGKGVDVENCGSDAEFKDFDDRTKEETLGRHRVGLFALLAFLAFAGFLDSVAIDIAPTPNRSKTLSVEQSRAVVNEKQRRAGADEPGL